MNLFTGANNFIKAVDSQKKESKNGAIPTKIGAKISAQISKDLGGGKYLLRLGNQTVAVESSSSFRENEKVSLQVMSSSDGNVEVEISSQKESQGVEQLIRSDSAKLTTPIQLSLPVAETATIVSYADQKTNNINNGLTLTVEVEKKQTLDNPTRQIEVNSKPTADTNRSQQNSSIPKQNQTVNDLIKIHMPDGRVITAEVLPQPEAIELIGDNSATSAETTTTEETDENAPPVEQTDKENSTGEKKAAGTATENAGKALKSFLTELAGKLLHAESQEAATAQPNSAQLKIQSINIPLIIENPLTGTQQQINIDLPLKDLASIIPQLLANPENISLTLDNSGQLQLTFSSPDSLPTQLPLPAELQNQLSAIFLQESSYPSAAITTGSDSIINALLTEELTTTEPQIQNKPTENLLKPQLSQEKMDQLLQQKNITPSNITREAASALIDNKLPITRDNIQALLALSAGREGSERTSFLQAGAKLLALDIPLSPPLASGISTLDNAANFLTQGISKILPALDNALAESIFEPASSQTATEPATASQAAAPLQTEAQPQNHPTSQQPEQPEINQPAANTAAGQNATETKNINIVQPETLRDILNSAKESLSGIPILIETLSEDTANLDSKLTESKQNPVLARELQDFVSTSARERLSQVEELIEKATNTILKNDPSLSRLSTALDSVLDKLGNQPPAETQTTPPTQTQGAEAQQSASEKATSPESKLTDKLQNFLENNNSGKEGTQASAGAKAGLDIRSFLQSLNISRSPAAHPGLGEFPAIWKSVELDQATLNNADAGKIKDTIEQILKAETPEQAKEIAEKSIKNIDRDTLRTLSSTLQELEKDELQKHPVLKNLREASSELRDIGRALVAQKAENLATSRNDPASFSASIPFNFSSNSEGEDGQLSMHYRKTRNKKGDWQQRVVLDLNMSILGNIIGDIQFYERQLNINLVSTNPETVAVLASEEDSLVEGLEDIGFSATLGVRLLEKEKPAAEKTTADNSESKHILDIKI